MKRLVYLERGLECHPRPDRHGGGQPEVHPRERHVGDREGHPLSIYIISCNSQGPSLEL